jgi:hypothetical protein
MDAGLEQCKEQDDGKLLRVVCRWIEICQINGKVGLFGQRERKGSMRTDYLGSVKDETMFEGRSKSFLYQKSSE